MRESVLTVERTIAAPAEPIFDLLADAGKHPLIDGSGTVRGPQSGSTRRLALGSTFGMAMHAGFGYSMVNTVIEYEENRRIAWQAYPAGPAGKVIGGRIWRYQLEPVEGGTRVTESWDLSLDHQRRLLRAALGRRTRRNMEATLARIAGLVDGARPVADPSTGASAPDAEAGQGQLGVRDDG